MTTADLPPISAKSRNLADAGRRPQPRSWAGALRNAATSWCVVAVLGQLMMVVYVIGFYGGAALDGDLARWNKVLPHGFVAGDTLGNLGTGLHLLFTVLITVGGALQLMPAIRRIAPAFHRWNGRAYICSALVMSIGGLTMVTTRGSVGAMSQHIGISINALLIILCAAMTLRHARARRLDLHRRWALRLFLVVSGVWFFRIGLMLWIVANQGPVGFDPQTFRGPFLSFLAFAQYLIPLAVLQAYFLAQSARSEGPRIVMSFSLAALTLLTAGGIASATMLLWLPRLS